MCLIEHLGKHPLTKEISLSFAACRLIGDIEPHMQNIASRYAFALHGRAENCLWVFGNSHEHICFATNSF